MDTNTKVIHTKNVHISKKYAPKVAIRKNVATKAARVVKNAQVIHPLNVAVIIKMRRKKAVSEEPMVKAVAVGAQGRSRVTTATMKRSRYAQ